MAAEAWLAEPVRVTLRIVRLGTPRGPGEGLRVGTVRRPPRGVPKTEHASRDFYDVWFPNLAPSEELLKAFARGDQDWKTFRRRFLAEMKAPHARRDLDLLAALSHTADLSIGCYCEEASRCHRSILQELLVQRGAALEP